MEAKEKNQWSNTVKMGLRGGSGFPTHKLDAQS